MAKTIDPWGSELPQDYVKIIKDFGLEEFKVEYFPNANRLMKRGVVFSARDQKVIAAAIKNKKPFYALTGIMPTGTTIHFGNKVVVEMLKYFQDNGAKTYILVADLEAAAARGVSLEEAQKRALEFHIPAYIALGLDPNKTIFYFQSQNIDVIHLAYEFSRKITLSEFKSIYGSADPGRIMSAVTQVGDILYPQLGKPMPGVIPVGVDQDPHIRLSRDVAKRTKSKYKWIPPSAVFNKYTPGLDGGLKMSKSKPESNIDLPEDPKSLKKKIMRAKTGGRDTTDEQRKKGGEPEKCIIFDLYKQHLIEDDAELDKIYKDCKAGKLLCGEDKKHCAELMLKFMEKFNQGVVKARKNINSLKFIKFK